MFHNLFLLSAKKSKFPIGNVYIANDTLMFIRKMMQLFSNPMPHKKELLVGKRYNNTPEFVGKDVIQECHDGTTDKRHDRKNDREQDDADETKRFKAEQFMPHTYHNT